MVGTLITRGVTPGFFSHIIVDEAAQALEPEMLIAFSLAQPTTPVVLAGDPRQLGATVRSPQAAAMGLSTSLQERLMGIDMYRRGDPRVVIQLRCNYRSHKQLLALPSRLFYEDNLEPCATTTVVEALCTWSELDQLGELPCPALWYGVAGKEVTMDGSFSSYNVEEASKISDIIANLLQTKSLGVTPQDFGVICPFRKQVDVIRRILRSQNLGAVRVGLVDDYQGQEVRITLVSTVAGFSKRHAWALQNGLTDVGFLGNAKKFNVAVTRAKALLVIVGHPVVLANDEYWGELLRFCASNHNYRGCSWPGLEQYDDNVGAGDDSEDEQARMEEFAELAATQALLGSAVDAWHPPDSLAAAFGNEPKFRVIL
eukprot:m.162816 g.162816  ORF g.162816 m.162816 type:complete len:371 (-) comp17674_c0_seq2:128-1240(-)